MPDSGHFSWPINNHAHHPILLTVLYIGKNLIFRLFLGHGNDGESGESGFNVSRLLKPPMTNVLLKSGKLG
jgi:hypothetical protein